MSYMYLNQIVNRIPVDQRQPDPTNGHPMIRDEYPEIIPAGARPITDRARVLCGFLPRVQNALMRMGIPHERVEIAPSFTIDGALYVLAIRVVVATGDNVPSHAYKERGLTQAKALTRTFPAGPDLVVRGVTFVVRDGGARYSTCVEFWPIEQA